MTKRIIEQQRRRLYFNQGREKEWIACRKSGCRADRENGKILTVRTFQAAKDSPVSTYEQVAEDSGCSAQETRDTLKIFGI